MRSRRNYRRGQVCPKTGAWLEVRTRGVHESTDSVICTSPRPRTTFDRRHQQCARMQSDVMVT